MLTLLEFTGTKPGEWRHAYMLVSNLKRAAGTTSGDIHYFIAFSTMLGNEKMYAYLRKPPQRIPMDIFIRQSERFKPDITGKSRIIDFCFTKEIKA